MHPTQQLRMLLCMSYMYSLCGVPVLTTDVGVEEDGHPKCILAVLLSLMNVAVLTTTVKLYLVPH